ncbi:MAG: hypothetical protein FWC43_04390 [Planctomycetaceae bacterium]|nr:hypothetical protein [Planctomycetaceae bacterium]
MPDWLNPIFVLKTQRWFVLLRKFGPLGLLLYLLAFYCSWGFFSTHDVYDFDFEGLIIVEYFVVGFLCFASCSSSVGYLPKRYIDEDLIHYTSLSDRQVLFGYFYVGCFYSGLACLCGTAIHLLFLPGLGIQGLIPLLHFFSLFLIAQTLNLLQASFFAGVRKQHEFILMGLAMYVTLIIFGHSIFTSIACFDEIYWKYVPLYVPSVSLCAYGLILWNLKRKVFLPWKMFRTGLAYTILAEVLSCIVSR